MVSIFVSGSSLFLNESTVNCHPVTVDQKVCQKSLLVTLRNASTHRNHELAKMMNTVFNIAVFALFSISLKL